MKTGFDTRRVIHVLYKCDKYKDVRLKYLPQLWNVIEELPNDRFIYIWKVNSLFDMNGLYSFMHHAFTIGPRDTEVLT